MSVTEAEPLSDTVPISPAKKKRFSQEELRQLAKQVLFGQADTRERAIAEYFRPFHESEFACAQSRLWKGLRPEYPEFLDAFRTYKSALRQDGINLVDMGKDLCESERFTVVHAEWIIRALPLLGS